MTKQHRRTFLTTVGVGMGSAALAGCIGSREDDGDTDDPDGDTNDPTGDDGTDSPDADVTAPAIADGESIDDFEEIEWNPLYDHTTVEASDEALVGDGSMLVEADTTESIGAYRVFPDGLDVEGKDLSVAIKIESPTPARVVLEARAPGRSDQLTSARSIPSEFTGWFRMEAGWTGKRGEPNLGNVRELRIYVQPHSDTNPTTRFLVDDLRATERGDQGYVVLTFDDGVQNQYTTAMPMLEERGWPGVAAVIPDSINQPDRLTVDQCREMRSAGWDIASHPHTALPEMESHDERVGYLEDARDYIANRIDEDGANHYFAPYNRMDADSLEAVREVFDHSYIHGGQPNIAPPTDGHMVSRVNGYALDEVSDLLDLAAEYNQAVVTLVHGVGDTTSDLNDISEADFETLLDEIESRDLQVVTASELANV
ncbi:polysaccharide deacetylase family protein [Halalkalicoccus jeotgali]|uniref:Polysaccharide deacetylase n=2 Tax=Halalkalicoccus jeotgali (strain DSM 18796 / CECT 7217 / JCM 14584 / KCTC 4019 / B3) TaxID=795797 RepID=L9VPG0_HALJB|nr:polysaccharide deacetylase family protein [Halalkalicoccus jeotgali]ELY38138.1 polysaccharide deacetylase [Halalkalicoccus jeotgali B3]